MHQIVEEKKKKGVEKKLHNNALEGNTYGRYNT
jgi:hypothetical protein